MERLLHYVWKYKLYAATPLITTEGRPVQVIDPGMQNTDAGPDFFNAKIKIDGTLWVGSVEIHDKSSDWLLHHTKNSFTDHHDFSSINIPCISVFINLFIRLYGYSIMLQLFFQ